MRADLRLLAAALPALAGSLWLMRQAGAGAALVTQQIAVAVVSFGAVALTRPRRPHAGTAPSPALITGIAVALLWTPLWVSALTGPERWLSVGGVRVYVASALLPALVLVVARALDSSSSSPRWSWMLMPAALWALSAQPDASQATAFALACGLPLARASAGVGGIKTLVAATLAAGVAWAWWQPDPLLPVPYVEGVLDLAADGGPVALVAALAALALPVLMLTRQARASSDTALPGVAIYYVAIGVLAWRQLTPMPLLGFGAGPIVGYALMVAAARRRP